MRPASLATAALGVLLALPLALPAAAQTGADPTRLREDAARSFAVDYLAAWSSVNPVAIDSVAHFYEGRVLFHGRPTAVRDLVAEKRRFVSRWPVRAYRHRPGTLEASCRPDSDLCRVRSVLDYNAENPRTGRRARGSAAFDLTVRVAAGARPVIVAETTRNFDRAALRF